VNWDAIGAIGELVGALAVIVTLIYLAIQLRSNAAASRASVAQALADSINSSNLLTAENEGLARIYRVGKEEDWDSLTDDEKYRWGRLATAVCRSLEAVLTHDRLGQADSQSVELAKETIKSLFATEAYRRWWAESHEGLPYTKDFISFVERDCLKNDAT